MLGAGVEGTGVGVTGVAVTAAGSGKMGSAVAGTGDGEQEEKSRTAPKRAVRANSLRVQCSVFAFKFGT
jgi:hypothetical protein